jgi:uncharacterized SAM-binding protein YcdF (DUF218 family)
VIRRALAWLFIAWAMGFAWFAIFLPRPFDGGKTDAIVVLTGAVGRIDRGIARLRAGDARQLLISGVDRDVKPAELAELYKIPRDLMRCCITLGREAVDTRSNAVETSAWIDKHGYRSVRLITSDWHMRRARYELSQQLKQPIRIVPDAVRSVPSLRMLLREYHKYLLRRAAGLLGI